MEPRREDFPEQHVCENEFSPGQQLWNQEKNSDLEQKEPECPQVKEEQEELEFLQVKDEQEELEPQEVKREQEEPEPPQIKEELCISQEEEQLVVKLEADTFTVTLISEEKQQSEAEPNSEQLLSHHFAGTEIQDEEESWHADLGSTKEEEEPKPKKRRLKTGSHYEDAPQLHDGKEEEILTVQQLCKQERNSSLDQEEKATAQVKEEEEELCTSQEEEYFGLKRETDTFMRRDPSQDEGDEPLASGNASSAYRVEWGEIRSALPPDAGAMYGKHVTIQAPASSGSQYWNYKGSFPIVLLAVVDAHYRFSVVDIQAHGRSSDGGILVTSAFGTALRLETLNLPHDCPLPGADHLGPQPHVFVADEAFPLCQNIMRPHPGQHLPDDKRMFNYRLSHARCMVECSFGILSSQWRLYRRVLGVSPTVAECVVKATCVLHNFLHWDSEVFDVLPTPSTAAEPQGAVQTLPRVGSNNASREAAALAERQQDPESPSESGSVDRAEVDRHRESTDVDLKSEMEPRREDVPQQNDFNQEEVLDEQQLLNQERNFIVVQVEAYCSQIKEEQEDICISQEGEQFGLKQEIQTSDEDFPEQHVCENEFSPDQQLWKQEENSVLDPKEPEPPHVKEEQEEFCISQEGEQLVVKLEVDTFMGTFISEEKQQIEAEPNMGKQIFRGRQVQNGNDRSCVHQQWDLDAI
ncbi:uncharacterized protein KZ484_010978 [Pholidichthys leucotaenia]